jgi:hypothetical protein
MWIIQAISAFITEDFSKKSAINSTTASTTTPLNNGKN